MTDTTTQTDRANPKQFASIPFLAALKVWIRVAILSFGGPAGQMAVMHRILVEEKRWVSENRFLHALNYTMLLPGPEAQQLATYIGWLLHSTRGGLVAGILFVLPGFITILVLSFLYAGYQDLSYVQGLFFGLKPAVMAIVVEAVVRIGRRVLKNRVMVGIAVAAFTAIFFFDVPFPIIVLTAGLTGYFGGRLWEAQFYVIRGHEVEDENEAMITNQDADHTRPSTRRAILILVSGLLLWFGPLVALSLWLGPGNVFSRIGVFFSQQISKAFAFHLSAVHAGVFAEIDIVHAHAVIEMRVVGVVREAIMLFFRIVKHKAKLHALARLLTVRQRAHAGQHRGDACRRIIHNRRTRRATFGPLRGHPLQIGHQKIGGRQ